MPRPSLITRVLRGIARKALDFFPVIGTTLFGGLPRATHNYAGDVGEGLDSNVLMAPMTWIMRNFTEATAVVESRRARRMWDVVANHDGERLIARPNPFYDGDALWKATVLSYVLNGNGYWIKVRNAVGEVIQLWYAPHWCMTPRWRSDGTTFIDWYDYTGAGLQTARLAPRDVVHFRFGIDPRNPRLGYGLLRPLVREIWSDDEAASFSATILQNHGVPGLIISPEVGSGTWQAEQATELKEKVDEQTTGQNRGGTYVMRVPMKVAQFGFDPNKLMLPNLRDISEERVCALLGIPAAVVGFGSGLQSTKVGATMRELRRAAWVACLTPMQKSLAKQLTAQLLPDLVSQTEQFRFAFDMTEVSAFQEEANLVADRADKLVRCAVLRRDRAQEMCGLEVDPTCNNYLIPSGMQLVDEQGNPIQLTPPAEGPDEPANEDDENDETADEEKPAEGEEEEADQKLLAAIAARVRGPTNGNH